MSISTAFFGTMILITFVSLGVHYYKEYKGLRKVMARRNKAPWFAKRTNAQGKTGWSFRFGSKA
ncbi:hypothetical protein CF8_0058 [Aeromonas phage CF8]|nr:hypothetical protein CF8_0058 [Aeromonas phage CF8]